jgi:hypothetical protein
VCKHITFSTAVIETWSIKSNVTTVGDEYLHRVTVCGPTQRPADDVWTCGLDIQNVPPPQADVVTLAREACMSQHGRSERTSVPLLLSHAFSLGA